MQLLRKVWRQSIHMVDLGEDEERKRRSSSERRTKSRTCVRTNSCERRGCGHNSATKVLTRPEDFDVIATLNLNGDYLVMH